MHKHVLFFLLSCCCFVPGVVAQNQQSITDSGRKLIRRVDPIYPEMARKMNLAGTVKVFAIVGPDGSVKSVEPVGGSPVLVQAAQDAVSRWKFAPASSESKELVELHFHPQ